MGFTLNQFVVIGGSEEFPVGDTDELRVARSKTLLTKAVQTIIACNRGWVLDTSKNATDTNYVMIPPQDGSLYYPGLFLRNTISGCKLFISHWAIASSSYIMSTFGSWENFTRCDGGFTRHWGMCVSIIPAGSESEFGDPTTNTFLPDDATRICSTYYRSSQNWNEKYTIGSKPLEGASYMYGFGVTEETIALFANHNDDAGGQAGTYEYYLPISVCGKIFGELAHEEDVEITAKYGSLFFRKPTSQYEGWAGGISESVSKWNSSSITVPQTETNNYINAGCITKTDASWINDWPGYRNSCVCMFTLDVYRLGNYVHSISGTTNWSAIGIAVRSQEHLDVMGIVPGDGFKGLLDTDLFRAGVGSDQQQFDNGRFRLFEASSGLLVGVDERIR